MNLINHSTPDQLWTIYQLVDQIREEILKKHKVSICYFLWREKRIEEYLHYLEQLSEEERVELGVWLEPEEPDDPIPF
jgi:hypothetical protein